MCRIVFAVGNGEKMKELAKTLVKSSENDPYKVAIGWDPYHKDGWGFVWVTENRVEYYKSIKPIFKDNKGVEKFLNALDGFGVLLAHTRAASQGGLSLFNAQPFVYSSPNGFNMWFCHNGDVKKEVLIEMAGLDGSTLKDASDTYVFGLYLLNSLTSGEEKEVLDAYKRALPTVNTSLNTIALFFSPKKISAFVTAYMSKREEENPLYRRFSRLLKVQEEELFAVVSSTFEVYSELSFEEIKNGTAFYLDMELENKKFDVRELTL